MISFDDIDKHSVWYDILIRLLCFAHNGVYYKRFVVANSENIPERGVPTLVIANHQNGMMDAMAILHTLYKDRRQPVFIARGDIFKKDAVARVLRFLKILPVFRKRDGGRDDIEKDLDIFRRASQVLSNKGTLVIFPEAGHQQGHYMSTFKKGFSRIAFMAEEMSDFKLGVQILPLNIHYSNYFEFRSDLLVTCGKPFTYEEFFQIYKDSPNQAYIALNEKARVKVKEMTPDIDMPEFYGEIDALTQIMGDFVVKRKGFNTNDLAAKKEASIYIISAVRRLYESDGDSFAKLIGYTREYIQILKDIRVLDWAVNRDVSSSKFALWTLALISLSPLAFFGLVNNLVPLLIVSGVMRLIKDPMMRSTFQYALGTALVIPIWYVVLTVLAGLLSKSLLITLLYVVFAAACGVFFRSYARNFFKFVSLVRVRWSKNRPVFKKIASLKSEISARMETLLF